jgi:hypothetical protein
MVGDVVGGMVTSLVTTFLLGSFLCIFVCFKPRHPLAAKYDSIHPGSNLTPVNQTEF